MALAIRAVKEYIPDIINYVLGHSKDIARKLYENSQQNGILETIFMIKFMFICYSFVVFLFTITAITSILFLICGLSVTLFCGVGFIASHMICITLKTCIDYLK